MTPFNQVRKQRPRGRVLIHNCFINAKYGDVNGVLTRMKKVCRKVARLQITSRIIQMAFKLDLSHLKIRFGRDTNWFGWTFNRTCWREWGVATCPYKCSYNKYWLQVPITSTYNCTTKCIGVLSAPPTLPDGATRQFQLDIWDHYLCR